MCDANICSAERRYFVTIKVNSVRKPGSISQPATLFKILQWAQSELTLAKSIFVFGFCQMRVQENVFSFGKFGRGRH